MSNCNGAVRFNDGKVMFYEYNGISDTCCTALWNTLDEVSAAWRTDSTFKKCTCENDEPVIIYSDYGYGFRWQGRACRKCAAITAEWQNDWDLLDAGGVPAWAREFFPDSWKWEQERKQEKEAP